MKVAIPSPRPAADDFSALRKKDLLSIGHALMEAGWSIPEMRLMVALHEIWGEVADLLEDEETRRGHA